MEPEDQREKNSELAERMTEEAFLKDLYFFMKQRDTPIERIPHLGFKQINLYVMFQTVMELGGYHQVTAQQLWKKVYNILGGNPRSTSAATCTRRHYEKLLLPYEYHSAGYGDEIPITPPRQRKRFRYEDEYGQNPKRPDFTHLHQFNQYLPPGPISLPRYLAVSMPSIHHMASMPPLSSPIPTRPMVPYLPPSPVERREAKQPLAVLRHLAHEYKSSSGWTEPLNLSKKPSRLEIQSNVPSSFTSPTAKKKEPKFLNEASLTNQNNPSAHGGVETSPKSRDEVTNLTPSLSSCSNVWKTHVSSAPATSLRLSSSVLGPGNLKSLNSTSSAGTLNLRPATDQYGGMEIQIPLSLLQTWIKDGLILSSEATRQHLPADSRVSDASSITEGKTSILTPTCTSHDHPTDLSLKNPVRTTSKSATATASSCNRLAAVKPLQIPEQLVSFHNHVPHLKSPSCQEREPFTNHLHSATKRIQEQPGLKPTAYVTAAAQINSIKSEKSSLSKVPAATPYVHINPDHVKLLLSHSSLRLERGKIC